MMPRLKGIAANCAVLVLAVAFSVAAFEFACRAIVDDGMQYHIEMWKYANALKRQSEDPAIGHEHRPNAAARLMGVDVAINGLGDRGPRLIIPKPRGVFRIVMLGDSLTFGWGVTESDLFVNRVAAELNRQGVAVETVNLGVGNTNTAMQTASFERRIASLDADLVVLNYFINDAEPTPSVAGSAGWIARNLVAYPVVGGAWDALKRSMFGAPEWKRYYRDLYADDAAGWQATQSAFRRLAALCRDRKLPLIVVNLPELRELDPYPFADVTAKVQTLATAEEALFFDATQAVAAERPSDLWVTVPDPHPNARAHALIGKFIAEGIAASDLMSAQ